MRTAGHSSSDLHGKSFDAHHHSLVPPHSTSGITVHSLLKSPSPRVLFESDNSHHNHRQYELYRSAAHGRRLKGTFHRYFGEALDPDSRGSYAEIRAQTILPSEHRS